MAAGPLIVTVSELVGICAPPTDAHRALWLRRAREWSSAGVLPPAKRHQQGTGRHRLYDLDAVYMGAVLFRMSDLGVPIGVLAQIARVIQNPRRTQAEREFREFWRNAIDKSTMGEAFQAAFQTHLAHYLAVAPVPGQESAYYRTAVGSIRLDEGAWAVINLSVTFAQLRF
jgi:DNA-binding transcriptional MerR regulator